MKKRVLRAVSSILTASVMLSALNITPAYAADPVLSAGGWFETLFAQVTNVKDSDITAVSYSGDYSGNLTGDDLTYLVRDTSNGVRIDIPGLREGTYNLSVTTKNGTVTASDIPVYSYDRTGYAHKDAKDKGYSGVGAYNDDGSLKNNATVIYVTDENKNTVTIPGMSDSPVGIGNILNYKSTASGSTSGSGKADTFKKLTSSDTPLVVRFVGEVYAGDENTLGSVPASGNINGLTAYDATGNGGTVGDNGMVARMWNVNNVTFEGIGTDACINGWGFQAISGTGRASNSIEFRNLTFKNTPEDAIGFEGTATESTNPQSKEWLDNSNVPIRFCWVHNCTFEPGYCKNPAESDKAEGDGSLDFKRGYGFTQSYNHYIQNHKTNLIGSSSKSIQYDVTYHHNFYDQVWSRQPLSRQANVHIYNSYFKNGSGTSYIYSPRANTYIFSEGNYFDGCKNPVDSAKEGTGYVKSFNDNFAACTGTNSATIATSATQAISGNNHPYKSDFDGSFPYSYEATSAVQAKADCIAKAGVMKTAADIDMDPTPSAIISEYPSAPLVLPYNLDLSATYSAGRTVVNNAILNAASKSSSGVVKIKDNGIIFTVNQQAIVSFSAGSSSKYGMTLQNDIGETITSIATSGSVSIAVVPGTYVLKSGNIEKDAYLESFKVVAVSGSETTEVTTKKIESTTQATTEATTSSQSDKPTETTTENTNSEVNADGYIWNGTTGENTDNFFYVSSNEYNSGSVSYKGATLKTAIKMESTTDIHFTAETDGTLLLYTYSKKSAPTIKINDTTESIAANGTTTFDIGSGETVYVTKGTTDTYIYFMQFLPDSTQTVTEITTEATTKAATETSTEATTKAATETSTEATTKEEQTTQPQAEGSVNISVEKIDGTKGNATNLKISATDTANNTIGGYLVALKLDSGLTYNSVENLGTGSEIEAYANGNAVVVAYVGSIEANKPLFNINLTPTTSGQLPVTVISQELINTSSAVINSSATNGYVNVAFSNGSGDVYKDGIINDIDAAYLLKYISGEQITDPKFDASEGNCDGSGNAPDVLDVVYILNHKTAESSDPETESTTINESDKIYIESFIASKDATIPEYLKKIGISSVTNHKTSDYPAFGNLFTDGSAYRMDIAAGKEFTFDTKAGDTVSLYMCSASNNAESKVTVTGSNGTYVSETTLTHRKDPKAQPVTFKTDKADRITVKIEKKGIYFFGVSVD